MESWIPFFNIFLNSPTPESEASLWLQHSFNPSSNPPITANSLITLLTQPADVATSSDHRLMFIETLPCMVQTRILSFLAYECESFCGQKLVDLAKNVIFGSGGCDFWVRRAAHNLLDKMSERDRGLDCRVRVGLVDKAVEDEFYELPDWLKDEGIGNGNDCFLPWLPLLNDDVLRSGVVGGGRMGNEARGSDGGEGEGVEDEVMVDSNEVQDGNVSATDYALLDLEIREVSASMSAKLLEFESASKIMDIANEICELRARRKGDALGILGLIEPWKAEDEVIAILLSHIVVDSEEPELGWPSQVLCATVLPKLLVLEEPASRVIVSATIEYCKLHQRAAEYALLFPLMHKKDGINVPICDVITRIMKESLHTAHIASSCQKLLCGKDAMKTLICLPCHRVLLSDELIWTEALFSLFQNIFNHNVHLTQDSVDRIVSKVQQLAPRFSNSLKFGHFLLCFVTKCSPMLKSNAIRLTEAAKLTNTLVTKSVLMKLASL